MTDDLEPTGAPADTPAPAPAPVVQAVHGIDASDAARARIGSMVAQGWTITTDMGSIVQMQKGKPVNHVLHLILTFLTCGGWAIVWGILVAVAGVKTQAVPVPDGKGSSGRG